MTTAELIVQLVSAMAEHGNRRVLLSKDGEGNAFHDIAELDAGRYDGESWVYAEEDRDCPIGVMRVLVLWPTN